MTPESEELSSQRAVRRRILGICAAGTVLAVWPVTLLLESAPVVFAVALLSLMALFLVLITAWYFLVDLRTEAVPAREIGPQTEVPPARPGCLADAATELGIPVVLGGIGYLVWLAYSAFPVPTVVGGVTVFVAIVAVASRRG